MTHYFERMAKEAEHFYAFTDRMGSEPVFAGGWWYFKNGAVSDGFRSHHEPPEDPNELLKNRYRYAVTRLDELLDLYIHNKKVIAEQIDIHRMGAGPMPASGWDDGMKSLRSKVQVARAVVRLLLKRHLPDEQPDDDYDKNEARRELTDSARRTLVKLERE